ncbi:uncharacterized protein LOC119641108 isoform X2 [Glossina fuscipes]|uniref:Uncharacterized protein LOC119641108 isoform X2 n=1 Tax=Glossina fuscipes TaxID=7396 RepID=A0A9C5ZG25_9MUSC|nr:uncharacterized protein LOC119641108 isoform X2 [Glossina fuscipes]
MCRRFEGTSRGKRSKDVKGPPKIQIKRIVYYTDKKKMKSNSTLIASSPHIDDDSLHTKVRFAFIFTYHYYNLFIFFLFQFRLQNKNTSPHIASAECDFSIRQMQMSGHRHTAVLGV